MGPFHGLRIEFNNLKKIENKKKSIERSHLHQETIKICLCGWNTKPIDALL